MSIPLPKGDEAMVERLVAEHEFDHLWPVDGCPECDREAQRVYCSCCAARFVPVPGRQPSQACSDCWLEIQAELGRSNKEAQE